MPADSGAPQKKAALVDVSVLILFFTRADRLREVFAQVRQARPTRLFLYQDGPRSAADEESIAACRAIVADEAIDWACTVQRHYETTNAGCDPSGYQAQAWAFRQTDKLIVLEDDCVPSVSFFAFCKALLDRYEHESRVWMIAGFNALGQVDYEASYFFTDVFSIWGWASWRRVFDTWDSSYRWMDDAAEVSKVEASIRRKGLRRDLLPMCRAHKASGIAHFETIFWSSMLRNDAVAIMSAQNQISNIGIASDGTHFTTTLATMPRRLRQQFLNPRYEVPLPPVAPTSEDVYPDFLRRVYLLNAWNNPWQKVQYSLEELVLTLRAGRFAAIGAALRRRLHKTFRRR